MSGDDRGVIWPDAIAPYAAVFMVVDMTDPTQAHAAETVYADLHAAGVDTLLDDRAERPGVKFTDADLWGIPGRVTVGRTLTQGEVEIRSRHTGEVSARKLADVVGWIRERVEG